MFYIFLSLKFNFFFLFYASQDLNNFEQKWS